MNASFVLRTAVFLILIGILIGRGKRGWFGNDQSQPTRDEEISMQWAAEDYAKRMANGRGQIVNRITNEYGSWDIDNHGTWWRVYDD